jgi:hypothetical protein
MNLNGLAPSADRSFYMSPLLFVLGGLLGRYAVRRSTPICKGR